LEGEGQVWLDEYLAFNPIMAWSCRPKPLVGYGEGTLAVGLCHCKQDEDYGLLISLVTKANYGKSLRVAGKCYSLIILLAAF